MGNRATIDLGTTNNLVQFKDPTAGAVHEYYTVGRVSCPSDLPFVYHLEPDILRTRWPVR